MKIVKNKKTKQIGHYNSNQLAELQPQVTIYPPPTGISRAGHPAPSQFPPTFLSDFIRFNDMTLKLLRIPSRFHLIAYGVYRVS